MGTMLKSESKIHDILKSTTTVFLLNFVMLSPFKSLTTQKNAPGTSSRSTLALLRGYPAQPAALKRLTLDCSVRENQSHTLFKYFYFFLKKNNLNHAFSMPCFYLKMV